MLVQKSEVVVSNVTPERLQNNLTFLSDPATSI